jgi:hypothetical protein
VYQLLPAYFPAARPASDVGLESLPVSLFRRLLDEDTAANLARVNRERGELQDAYYALGAFMRASVPLEATLCTEHGLDVDAECVRVCVLRSVCALTLRTVAGMPDTGRMPDLSLRFKSASQMIWSQCGRLCGSKRSQKTLVAIWMVCLRS